mmetsp:Transcript_19931/g.76341  ORF Transcript_19931/g.76341 Transcript_19931/m.76341 type:complete len:210 (+) Transcript_19931:962-1591(+)
MRCLSEPSWNVKPGDETSGRTVAAWKSQVRVWPPPRRGPDDWLRWRSSAKGTREAGFAAKYSWHIVSKSSVGSERLLSKPPPFPSALRSACVAGRQRSESSSRTESSNSRSASSCSRRSSGSSKARSTSSSSRREDQEVSPRLSRSMTDGRLFSLSLGNSRTLPMLMPACWRESLRYSSRRGTIVMFSGVCRRKRHVSARRPSLPSNPL